MSPSVRLWKSGGSEEEGVLPHAVGPRGGLDGATWHQSSHRTFWHTAVGCDEKPTEPHPDLPTDF